MGTNFYAATTGEHRGQHIGKRSAAGLFCWDCNVTLAKSGRPHEGSGMFAACPTCSKVPEDESLEHSAAGRELGFNKTAPERKAGVRSCCSFSWAVEPEYLEGVAEIEDEYGRSLTREEFLAMLEECPIKSTDSIGIEFS